jgi:CubicO group peptidase (beta-lactamase class C family)
MRRAESLWRATIVLTIASSLAVLPAAGQDAVARPGDAAVGVPAEGRIDALAERALEVFETPGLAIGVVKDGELVYARGHGVREIGRSEPVDPDTLFQIASLTKAFTAAALGLLVDEGELDWDDRVIDHLPQFRMYDPWVTREFTVRDLLTHRSGLGLGAGDLLFWPEADSTREDVIRAMRHLEPVTSFRTAYAYDNLLYVIAGEVVGAVSGLPWEDFVERRILEPLGMEGCRSLPARVEGSANRATPHMVVDGELVTTFFSTRDATAAAGAINCNISGLAKWAAMHLAGGELPDGGRLLSKEVQSEMWRPVTLTSVRDLDREHGRTHFAAYALGWATKDFLGRLHVSHGGGLQGMTSHIALLPEEELAVIVLTNQWSRASRALTSQVLDDYLSPESEDWIELFAAGSAERAAEAREVVEEAFANRAADSRPSLPLEEYAGTYRDAWYGEVFVEREGGGLKIRFGRSEMLTGPLEHFQYDTFVARWLDRSLYADAYVTFALGADGRVEAIRMEAVSPDTDFSYDFHDLDLRRVAAEEETP